MIFYVMSWFCLHVFQLFLRKYKVFFDIFLEKTWISFHDFLPLESFRRRVNFFQLTLSNLGARRVTTPPVVANRITSFSCSYVVLDCVSFRSCLDSFRLSGSPEVLNVFLKYIQKYIDITKLSFHFYPIFLTVASFLCERRWTYLLVPKDDLRIFWNMCEKLFQFFIEPV